MIKKNYIIVLFFLILSLFISFFFKLDSAGGMQEDLVVTWRFITDLNSDLSLIYTFGMDYENDLAREAAINLMGGLPYPVHYPLHSLIVSRFDFFVENKNLFLKTFFLISLFIPIVFYKCLVLRFENVKKEKLILLASLIYLLPSFRSSAIWGNQHATATFFLLFSLFFYLKWNQNKNNLLNINILSQVIFLTLAAYTKNYYIILFPFFFIKYLKFLNTKSFILLTFFTFLLSLPGVFLFIKNQYLFTAIMDDTTNFFSSILVTSSIMAFYLTPFFIVLFFSNINFIKKQFFNKKSFFNLILSTVIVISLSLQFLYMGNVGGGVFLKISRYIFNNEIFFFFSSVLGLFFLLSLINNKIENLFLVLLLLVSFSTGVYIFNKYFEPMILILLFCLLNKEITYNFLNNKILLVYIYFILYLLVAIIQSEYNLIQLT